MTRYLSAAIVLLTAVLAQAQPLQRSVPEPIRRFGTPENAEYGYTPCDRACNESDGRVYKFAGQKGSRAGWVLVEEGVTTPTLPPFCGDGITNGNDECDGASLPDASCLSCDSGCHCVRASVCGNNLVETNRTPVEVCDPPNTIGTAAGCTGTDQCNSTCSACVAQAPPVCGDSVVDAPEVCDPPFEDGGCGSGDICNATCTACGDCGDGVDDGPEQCDPGDRYSATTDGSPAPAELACGTLCQPDCTCPSPAVCGNGVVETLGGEVCDNNPNSSDAEVDKMSCLPQDCVCIPGGGALCNCGPNPGPGTCGNGMLDQDCIGLATSPLGNDEDCGESTTGSTADFDLAVQFGTAGCVLANDSTDTCGFFDTLVDNSLDFTTQDFVIEFFMRMDNITAAQVPIWKGGQTSTSNGWMVQLGTDGAMKLIHGNSGGAPADPDCSSLANKFAVGNVYHVVITKTGTACKFYQLNLSQNPVPIAHTDITDGTKNTIEATLTASTNTARLGRRNTNNGEFYGLLDEVRIWSAASGSGLVTDFTANKLDTVWRDELPCDTVNLTARWHLDDKNALANNVVECVSNTAGTQGTAGGAAGAGWSRITSPVTALLAGSTTSECASGETCNANCQCQPDCTSNCDSQGKIIYIDDNGNNANDGLDRTRPVKSWSVAFDKVTSPGDTVIALDGTYTKAANGQLNYSCGTTLCTGARPCGNETQHITIKADNEHQAHLNGDGSDYDIRSTNCRFVDFVGFYASNADHRTPTAPNPHNVFVEDFENVTVAHTLCTNTNNYFNNHCIRFESGKNPIDEYNECYGYQRHCVSVRDSIGGRSSYNYCNSRNREAEACTGGNASCTAAGTCITGVCCQGTCKSASGNWKYGDECISVYGTQGHVVENNISDGRSGGFQAHGDGTFIANGTPTGQELGGSDELFYGNISLRDELGLYSDARTSGGQAYVTKNNKYVNNIVSQMTVAGRGSLWLRSASSVLAENNTLQGGADDGFRLDETSGFSCATASTAGYPCGFTATNILAFENSGDQIDLGNAASFTCTIDQYAISATTALTNQCGGDNAAVGTTITGQGIDANETLLFVRSTATSAYAQGATATAVNTKVCHGGDEEGTPCTVDGDCAGAGTCSTDIGANVLYRYINGQQTYNDGCTAVGAGPAAVKWPACTGNGTGHNELWAAQSPDCGGGACASGSGTDSNCVAADVRAVGTANMPKCTHHFIGCGAIVAGVNDVDGDSCFDVHEEPGLNIGQKTGSVTIPDYPQ